MNLKNLLAQITKEAIAYENRDQLKSLIQSESGLKNIPIQPLYQTLKSLSIEEKSEIIPMLSKAQRRSLYDIDLWKRDDLDIASFESWLPTIFNISEDEVKTEFLMSTEFTLFLKGRFNISTFDVEDPMYPEHEEFFLTEDNLLLIEYDKDFPYVQELQNLIRHLYSEIGVENAYAFLFKVTSDSFIELQESEYRDKKERLRDLGFVDYYDALEFISSFPSKSHIDHFVKNKKAMTSGLSPQSKNQTLNSQAIRPYEAGLDFLDKELEKVSDQSRLDYLKFNFLRMVNATMTLDDALKSGKIAMNRVSKKTLFYLRLGYSYMQEYYVPVEEKEFFDIFDFSEIYRVGFGLLSIEKAKIKKNLRLNGFGNEEEDAFLGNYWNVYLDNCMTEMPSVQTRWGETQIDFLIDTYQNHQLWESINTAFNSSLPYIKTFHETWKKVKTDGQVHDYLYLNYDLEQVDFEAILLSSFFNYVLGAFEADSKKLGVSVADFQKVYQMYFDASGTMTTDEKLKKEITAFAEKFGLAEVHNFKNYMFACFLDNLEGYEIDGLSDEEYKHIGGPIIFNSN